MLGVFFWVLILLAIVLGGIGYRGGPYAEAIWWGGGLILLLLILILGIKVFGNPLAG